MNLSGKFILILLLNFQKYKIQQQVHIYICFYLCRLHRERIHRETRCAFCVSCSLRHSNEPATLLNEGTNQKIQIFNYLVGMKRCISILKSASHSATLSFQRTLTEKKSLVYIYAFSRRFYPKVQVHSSYSFYIISAFAFPGNRTHDLGVASAMLYQLSYRKALFVSLLTNN